MHTLARQRNSGKINQLKDDIVDSRQQNIINIVKRNATHYTQNNYAQRQKLWTTLT